MVGVPGMEPCLGRAHMCLLNACCGGPQEEKGAGRGTCTGAGTCKMQTHGGGLQEDGDGLKQQETLGMILRGTGRWEGSRRAEGGGGQLGASQGGAGGA